MQFRRSPQRAIPVDQPERLDPAQALAGFTRLGFQLVLLLVLVCRGFVAESFAAEESVAFTQDVSLTWGIVKSGPGGQISRPSWYLTALPDFSRGGRFSSDEIAALRHGFELSAGLVGTAKVWRIGAKPLSDLIEDVGKSARLTIDSISTAPAPLSSTTAKTISWTLEMAATRPAATPNDRHAIEVALLVDGIARGEAAHVSLSAALASEKVKHYAALSAEETKTLSSNADWLQLFLTDPATLADNFFPTFREVSAPTELNTYAIPIAYGLRALLETSAALSADRVYSQPNEAAVNARLSLDPAKQFPGADQWFPNAGPSGDLDGASVDISALQRLVAVRRPQGDAAFVAKRVLPENEWAILAGPFCRMTRATVKVGSVRDHGEPLPLDKLDERRPKDAAARERIRDDVRKLDTRLGKILQEYPVATGDFFWRPDVKRNHTAAMRALESAPFIQDVSAEFDQNGVTYVAVYAPATVEGKLGLSYDPEHGSGAAGEVSWTGLFDPTDSFHLSLAGEERATTAELAYKRLLQRGLDRRTFHWIALTADAGQDENYLLRNLNAHAFHNDTRSAGIEYEFDLSPALKAGAASEPWKATIKTAARWESFKLRQSGLATVDRDSGVLLHHEELWRFTPTPSADASFVWDYSLSPSLSYAPSLGWDHSFGEFSLAGATKVKFGGEAGSQENAMYVGLRGTAAGSLGTLPTGYLFRLGDSDLLVGLEPGEYSGRSYFHSELSYGVNLGYALGGMFKDNQGVKSPPAVLNTLAIEALAELGAISSQRTPGALDRARTTVSSYGLCLKKPTDETGATSLRIGYAWSPEGLHDHGRVFASFALGF